MYSEVLSGAICGIDGEIVHVEADVSDGLPAFSLVGLLSSEVKEAGERVRNALRNSGYVLSPKHITVNLSPADMRKSGTGFDLPIAIAILCSYGVLPKELVEDTLFLGELGLDGMLKPIKGILSIVDAAKLEGIAKCVVPLENVAEAKLVADMEVLGAASLSDLMAYYLEHRPLTIAPELDQTQPTLESMLDFGDVHGQEALKRAVLISVSGMHNILIAGPPGAGKSMIAKRIPTIMPDLTYEESVLLTKIYSASVGIAGCHSLLQKRPFRSPHHTISKQALIGGGVTPRPGEITLAHGGVLFLDEFPEFSKMVIEVLRQPMEDRCTTISRVNGSYTFPSEFVLVAAMNLCPCGHYPDLNKCTCTQYERKRYLSKISQPILDRIDLQILVQPVTYKELFQRSEKTTSRLMKSQVEKAQSIQFKRYEKEAILFNSQLEGKMLEKYCILNEACQDIFEKAHKRMQLSARGSVRILRVARTIADLDGSEWIEEKHLLEAMAYKEMEGIKG